MENKEKHIHAITQREIIHKREKRRNGWKIRNKKQNTPERLLMSVPNCFVRVLFTLEHHQQHFKIWALLTLFGLI